MKELVPTIGIEVHAELKTNSKAFSSSINTYGEVANSKVSVVDLGYPGTLPVLNNEVIKLALKAALVLNCQIQNKMYFDRKNYFYPDLPKGYQITQSTMPIGHDGYIEIEVNHLKKKIGIERIHIEEDTCKSIHNNGETLLDFNRAGIPLVEIVSLPVISNEDEAVLYLEKLRELLFYTEVSDVKIEEGSLRCDANVSLREIHSETLGTKTEIKNIGSISSVKEAILYEIKRQREIINSGGTISEETRRYDEKNRVTVLMRKKETSNDYRYFPEPDIPNIEVSETLIDRIKSEMPLLPDELRTKYTSLGINDIAISALIQDKQLSSFLQKVILKGTEPIMSANVLTGDVLAYLNKHNISISETKLSVDSFKEVIDMLVKGDISSKIGKSIINELLINGGNVKEVVSSKGLKQISDQSELDNIIANVISNNASAITDFKSGNDRAIKYLMGQIMKQTKGQANPVIAREILVKKLNEI